MNQRATVRPNRWRETVADKIGQAQQRCYELGQSERPEFNRYQDPRRYAADLVGAARGVFQVTHTLAGNPRPWPWYDNHWLQQRLSQAERELWGAMTRLRSLEEHGKGAGADLIDIAVPVTQGNGSDQVFNNYAVRAGIPPCERPGPPNKFTVRFASYPNRLASDVGREYIELCNRCADDFERDHP